MQKRKTIYKRSFQFHFNLRPYIKVLLKRGADCTKTTTVAIFGVNTECTALEYARLCAGGDGPRDFAATFALLCLRCCSTCGITSSGLAKTEGSADVERRLKRCPLCPVGAPRAHYCGPVCQRADWVARHRAECAEARRVLSAAGTEI